MRMRLKRHIGPLTDLFLEGLRVWQLLPLFGLVAIWPMSCMAQFEADSLAKQDSLTQINTSAARLGINTFAFKSYAGTGTILNGRNSGSATILSDHIYNTAQEGNNKFVTADIFGSLRYAHSLSRSLKWVNYLHILDYGANRNRISWVGTGLQFNKQLHAQQSVGIRAIGELIADKRADITNYGPGYEVAGQYNLVTDSGLVVVTGGRFWQGNISPRQQQAYLGYAMLSKAFGEEAFSQLGVSYRGRQVQDYLTQGDGMNIQSIMSDTLTANLRVIYALSDRWSFRSANQLTLPNRTFDYRTYTSSTLRQSSFYKQMEWDLKQSLQYQNSWVMAEERFEYYYRDRYYGVDNNLGLPQTELERVLALERVKDITEVSQAWYSSIRLTPGSGHTISLSSVAQLLRVDTRSNDNNQDRDEVLYSGEASYRRQWAGNFQTDVKVSGSYRHLVYITAEQSVENFKERILRLEPSFVWAPGRFSLTGNYSLFVTYHVRDFETEQGKNRSNRILLGNIKSQYRISTKYMATLDVLRRENRLGQLNWSRFTESPIDTVVIWDVTAKMQRRFRSAGGTALRLDLGYRMFRQNRASIGGLNDGGGAKLIYLDNIILQHGPVMTLAMATKSRLNLSTDFWIQTTAIYNEYRISDIPFTGASRTADELDQVQRNFFPNFNLTLSWNLNRPGAWRRPS